MVRPAGLEPATLCLEVRFQRIAKKCEFPSNIELSDSRSYHWLVEACRNLLLFEALTSYKIIYRRGFVLAESQMESPKTICDVGHFCDGQRRVELLPDGRQLAGQTTWVAMPELSVSRLRSGQSTLDAWVRPFRRTTLQLRLRTQESAAALSPGTVPSTIRTSKARQKLASPMRQPPNPYRP
jgi:hypothetical protein